MLIQLSLNLQKQCTKFCLIEDQITCIGLNIFPVAFSFDTALQWIESLLFYAHLVGISFFCVCFYCSIFHRCSINKNGTRIVVHNQTMLIVQLLSMWNSHTSQFNTNQSFCNKDIEFFRKYVNSISTIVCIHYTHMHWHCWRWTLFPELQNIPYIANIESNVCWSSLVDIVFNFRSRNFATSSSTKRRCSNAFETRRLICISNWN